MGAVIALVIAVGFAVPIAVIGGGLGQGKAAAAALEAIARQPEAAGRIRSTMIVGLALIESLVIYAFVIALVMLFFGVPGADKIVKIVGK